MQEEIHLLSLPDLALHFISGYLSNPFDLLNFGSTCRRLYDITLSSNLWWEVSVDWFSGIWYCIDSIPPKKNSRQWLLRLLQDIEAKPTGTKLSSDMGNNELWQRVESRQFRCYMGMLQLAYTEKMKERHPLVLYERWLYDIAIFRRENPYFDFEKSDSLRREVILEFAKLGQAKERDLRARKQPFLDPAYYIRLDKTSYGEWTEDLFPCGPFGSKFPLLLCPFQGSLHTEVSGKSGLLLCASLVIEKHIIPSHRIGRVPIPETAYAIRSAVEGFACLVNENYQQMKTVWGYYCLTDAVKSMATEDTIDLKPWQVCLDTLNLNLNCKKLMTEIHTLIQTEGGIDSAVNIVRSRWRTCLAPEIKRVLNHESHKVTRMNITDSDLIGGDNSRQEMSAAAFISESAVLITWQLIGRTRY